MSEHKRPPVLLCCPGSPPGDPVACDGRIPVRFNTVTGWVALVDGCAVFLPPSPNSSEVQLQTW